MKEISMTKTLTAIVTALGFLSVSGAALAQGANTGEPFGKEVVSPAARADPASDDHISKAVGELTPGGVDDKVADILADDEEGDIRGHGRKDAPGRQ